MQDKAAERQLANKRLAYITGKGTHAIGKHAATGLGGVYVSNGLSQKACHRFRELMETQCVGLQGDMLKLRLQHMRASIPPTTPTNLLTRIGIKGAMNSIYASMYCLKTPDELIIETWANIDRIGGASALSERQINNLKQKAVGVIHAACDNRKPDTYAGIFEQLIKKIKKPTNFTANKRVLIKAYEQTLEVLKDYQPETHYPHKGVLENPIEQKATSYIPQPHVTNATAQKMQKPSARSAVIEAVMRRALELGYDTTLTTGKTDSYKERKACKAHNFTKRIIDQILSHIPQNMEPESYDRVLHDLRTEYQKYREPPFMLINNKEYELFAYGYNVAIANLEDMRKPSCADAATNPPLPY